jgi:Cu/Ag efflux protein CusF
MKTAVALLVAWLAVATGAVAAALPPPADAAEAASLTEGEVRKVERDAQKLTLRHGAIVNLDMPPMTMVFRVSDPAMLDNLEVGAKVRFHAEKVGGQLTVTRIQPGNG